MKKSKKAAGSNNFPSGQRLSLALAVAISLGVCLQTVQAEESANADNPDFTLEGVTVEAKRPDWESKLSPGSVTVIRPDDYKGEQKTLPDLLKNVPGVHVREVGGKGQYTTVSIRGSTAAQVGIFIDGVLTNLGGDAAVDISTIPVKNVERIEVYRGYIPSRFGGTYMGGVINIVTKRPTKANVSAEAGRAAYGGATYSMQIDTPLGSGSLMVGLNREQSDGDFPYKNYAAERNLQYAAKMRDGYQAEFDNFNGDMIDNAGQRYNVSLTATEKATFKANTDQWLNFVRDDTAGQDNFYSRAYAGSYAAAPGQNATILWASIKDTEKWAGRFSQASDFKNFFASADAAAKAEVYRDYAQAEAEYAVSKADPQTNSDMAGKSKELTEWKKKIQMLEEDERHRRYNDFKNTDALIKWQDDNWMIKASWKKIDRHLPDSLWVEGAGTAVELGSYVDAKDIYYAESRRQVLDAKEFLVQRRDTAGKLEWGWMLDYLHQDKKYNTEKAYDLDSINWKTPLRLWSNYKSNKYNAQLDGSYKLTDHQLLEFQSNFSSEKMKVRGSGMDDYSKGDTGQPVDSLMARFRNYYRQELLNVQIQDTFTMDQEETLWLTASGRYNQSRIVGRSTRLQKEDAHQWFGKEDDQTNGKATWQLALKKQFTDNFTMRMTGGTYYRLLNLYEIAGDGAGILPPPRGAAATGTAFPLPEEGKQFDISALLSGKALNADANLTLTYFWRDSDNMLQLARRGLDYWSYFNDNRGKAHGVEIQTGLNWQKVSFDLQATYTKVQLQRRNSTFADYGEIGPWRNVWPTYAPEWEGSARLTYHPTAQLAIFGQVKYVDQYFTDYSKSKLGGEASYLSGKPVDSLTTVDAGIKWKPNTTVQVTIGCNDIFNKGPQMKIYSPSAFAVDGYINPEFPIQGRTYYATVRYEF
ncbi:TonB-dependent receptor [Sporomusa aerivorans]|uniref:TonB-dependent receptor n=1 Tax=Sporomusa aerivorans TaxID=204936 RepID=UPI00352A13B0